MTAVSFLRAAAVCTALHTAAAFGQPTDCSAVKDDAARLKCYDAAPKVPPAKTAPKPASDPVITAARAAIAAKLKDPPSARFEGVVKRPGAICGFVNAKTSGGGYGGKRMFVYVIKEKRGYILEVGADDATFGLAAAEAHCADVPGF